MNGNGSPIPGSCAGADEVDDARLVDALREGDQSAYGLAVNRYHPALVRYAMAHTGDRSAAEDIVQDTWLALVRGLERFEGRSSLRTWLFRVLSYKVRDHLGHPVRTIPFSDFDEPPVGPDDFPFSGDGVPRRQMVAIPCLVDMPEESFLKQEILVMVGDLIAKLPDRQRRVLVLRDVEGIASHDVCDLLQLNDGAMRVLLCRARARVRQGIEQSSHETPGNDSLRR